MEIVDLNYNKKMEKNIYKKITKNEKNQNEKKNKTKEVRRRKVHCGYKGQCKSCRRKWNL
jgi:hypothetical protein